MSEGEGDALPATTGAIALVKGPDALRTIGEVATELGLKQHVLRYWEEQFPTLRPIKRSGGRRYYRPEDIELLRTIHRLVDQQGYTLRGARQAIENTEAAGVIVPTVTIASPSAADAASPMIAGEETRLVADTLIRLRQVRRVLSDALAAS